MTATLDIIFIIIYNNSDDANMRATKTRRGTSFADRVRQGKESPPYHQMDQGRIAHAMGGNEVEIPRVRLPQSTHTTEVCPECFSLGTGGGIMVGGTCSNCGFATREFTPPLKAKRGPRTTLDWAAPFEDGPSLTERAIEMRNEGMKLREIAAELGALTDQKIATANVSAHTRGDDDE